MPGKNYYVILGVSRSESPAGIRAAYRDLAKRLHPDRVGDRGTAAFQEIAEAYGVLSDPAQRQQHDQALNEAERQRSRTEVFRRTVVEPLVPEPVSLFDRREDIHPSFEAFFDRYQRNFSEDYVPKSEHLESLTLDVVLSPFEALLGCSVPVGVPVFHVCPVCGGSGQEWLFPCLECRAAGYIEQTRTLRVEVPPCVPAGSIFEVPLDSLGIRNLYLRLHISISDEV